MDFRAIIEMWPSFSGLATDLGVDVTAVYNWQRRNTIPARRWPALLRAARRRRLGLKLEQLERAAA